MEMYYRIVFFILGSIMGSFFHVVATRLSKDESIIKPSSHCHICNRKLKWYELIPILSYVIQGGKSRCCKQKLPISYLIIEVITGSLFSVTYHVFKLTPELLINLIFISGLIIVIISDIEYMIILDEVLSFSSFLIIILDIILASPNKEVTKLKSNKPTRSHTIAPIMVNTKATFCKVLI